MLKTVSLENYNLLGWVALSAVLHGLIFFSVNKLYLHLRHFEPPRPLIIDVSIEVPPTLPEPEIQPTQQEAPAAVPHEKAAKRAAQEPSVASERLHETTGIQGGTSGSSSGSSPEYSSNPKPPYPEAARRAHKEGTVLLSVTVNADGSASNVEVAQSSGTTILDASAQQTVLHWRFVPARLNGESIESNVIVPIKFQIEDD